ncbi:hypothetical protein SH139x_000314 [Planctomycetaceae bacterium SH139]
MIRNTFFACLFAVVTSFAIPSSASACDCGVPAVGCCAPAPVCCPPPPVTVNFCAVDPCTGCSYPVAVCLPACCAGEIPCMTGWRKGFFGRKVLTYKFSCGECVEVVITRTGRTIVR